MPTFEIKITHGVDGPAVVVEHRGHALALERRVQEPLIFDTDPNTYSQSPNLTKESYGLLLGEAVFHGEVSAQFGKAMAEAAVLPQSEGSDNTLHVSLSVEVDRLRSLRWERLRAPFGPGDQWDFLATNQNTPFSLALPTFAASDFPPIGRGDLRALVVVADPTGIETRNLRPIPAVEALQNVHDALGPIQHDVLFTSNTPLPDHLTALKCGPATRMWLSKQLTSGATYTILHIVCHGELSANDVDLLLANSAGQVGPVSATSLIDDLRNLNGLPQLVFLASCHSGNPRAEQPGALGGLAQRLVRDLGLPAVVAMTDVVYSKTAFGLTETFYKYLQDFGDPDRALAAAAAALVDRGDVLVPVLYSRLGDRPLFSRVARGLLDLSSQDIEYGLDKLEGLVDQWSPRLSPRFEKEMQPLRDYLRRETPLESDQRERDRALLELDRLCAEIIEISFAALAQKEEPVPYDNRCPFPGYNAFGSDSSAFYFGRENVIDEIPAPNEAPSFLALLGQSGSGKTSLLLAGLVPAWQQVHPTLRLEILTLDTAVPVDLDESLPPGIEVLVVDQFERHFLWEDDAVRARFLESLRRRANEHAVIVVARDDVTEFLPTLAGAQEQPGPWSAMRDLIERQQVVVKPLDGPELREVIEQQAAAVGLRFESTLARQLIEDAAGQRGAMALLQETLRMLWEWRHGRWLSAEEYRNSEINGVAGIGLRDLESTYQGFSTDDRARVRQIFLRLVQFDGDASEDGRPRYRARWVDSDDLLPADESPHPTRLLIEILTNTRLIVAGARPNPGGSVVEAAHQAMIERWERLRSWVDQDKIWLEKRQPIRDEATKWDRGKRDPALLRLEGAPLKDAAALTWLPRGALSQREAEYLAAASRREEGKEANRQRWTYVGIAAALLLLAVGVLALIAWNRGQEIKHARLIQALASQSVLEHETGHDDLAALLARQSYLLEQGSGPNTAPVSGLVEQALRTAVDVPIFSHRLPGGGKWTSALAFHPTQAKLVAADGDGSVVLWDLSDPDNPPIATTLKGRGHPYVTSMAFSPDGSSLVGGTGDLEVWLWQLNQAIPPATVVGEHGKLGTLREVRSVAVAPDGGAIASGGDDGIIHLWEKAADGWTDEGIPASPRDGDAEQVNALAFSPDGRSLAWGTCSKQDANVKDKCDKGQVFTLDLDTNGAAPVLIDDTFAGPVWAVAFRPQGDTSALAAGGCGSMQMATSGPLCIQGLIRLYDLTDGSTDGQFMGHDWDVWSLAFSPDGKTLASGGTDGQVRLWDPRYPGDPAIILATSEGYVRDLSFSFDGRWLASASVNGTVRLWDIRQPSDVPKSLEAKGAWVFGLSFLPPASTAPGEPPRLAVGDYDGWITSWLLRGSEALEDRSWTWRASAAGKPAAQRAIRSVAISGDRAWLAWVTAGGEVWRRSLAAPDAKPEQIGSLDKDLWSVALNSDGTLVATAGGEWNGGACLFNLTESAAACDAIPGSELAWTVAFSPNDEFLAIGCGDGAIRLVRPPEIDNSTVFDPNGAARANGCVPVQDADVPARESASGRPRGVRALAFSPDSQSLASGGQDTVVRLWQNLDQPSVTVTNIGQHNGVVRSLAFHPDGELLASGGEDQTVRLWKPLRPDLGGTALGEEEDWIRALAFSDDGKLLASPSYDGSVRLWAGSAQLLAEQVCSRIWRDDETDRAWHAIMDRLIGDQSWWEGAWDRIRGNQLDDRPPCGGEVTAG